MLLDLNVKLKKSNRIYHTGEIVQGEILIKSCCKFTCRSIKVRFVCPYKNEQIEYFKIYEYAEFLGDEGGEARDFNLRQGLNKFNVTFEVPHLSKNIFLSESRNRNHVSRNSLA